ncbi:WD40 repeat-like protein [Lophiostoma macrostomum CBS 122681]|uniref:Probable cytosolic iron-sulfur protein assembly protein 1 n=1 Tax=Lophiostoma macrostomum CBS 122681 TaxID=1314788 RepID=A0A6A6TTE7_9PLEO|nr:WD40 repeat-like protein [Lophiostoma macrostomum CBS 122681]
MSPSLTTPSPAPTHTLHALATLNPPSNSRTWQSAPHPTQPLVATACADRTVRVYSLTSFTLLHTVSGGHKRSIRSVSWKPGTRGQNVLATGSFDASAGIWRRHESSRQGTIGADEIEQGGGSEGEDEKEEEDEEDYQFSCILDGHESEIKSLSWSPTGQYLATCSRDKSVWIWEEIEDDNFETVAVLSEHEGDVKCVAWHPEEDLLASASYDDTVRLYREDGDDWCQVAYIGGERGHGMTVWWVEFEGPVATIQEKDFRASKEGLSDAQKEWIQEAQKSGPRLATCSDDCTVRIWRRTPKETAETESRNTGVPSIIRSFSVDEDWVADAILPRQHERAVYSVSWSRRTGMIVSAGSDGKVVVYKERWKSQAPNGTEADVDGQKEVESERQKTEWVVVAELFSTHDVFEINHVCWVRRADKGRKSEDEEVIVSTGDDGEVKVWTLEESS